MLFNQLKENCRPETDWEMPTKISLPRIVTQLREYHLLNSSARA